MFNELIPLGALFKTSKTGSYTFNQRLVSLTGNDKIVIAREQAQSTNFVDYVRFHPTVE